MCFTGEVRNRSMINREFYSLKVFLITFYFSLYHCKSEEIKPSVKLNVDGNGLHRTLFYSIDTGHFFKNDCDIALYLELSSALYVNPDELADLHRHRIITACSTGETDVELFMEKAKSQNVTVCSKLIGTHIILRLPVHQRYQYTKEDGGYIDIKLDKPKLLLSCTERVKEYRVSTVNLCSPCVDLGLKWREVPFTMEGDKYIWSVPVGNSSLLKPVTYITLAITVLSTAYILRALWTFALNAYKKDD
ncbi:phosphatidylinositol-glycan biosynthesis class X protein [Prorops nasuta]|uniref:phosphatidylinositol-glycan biosynthesis class X protein n=1 Tax=Prorops nasuta TaxID=863751 RepID=UPI0034CF1832